MSDLYTKLVLTVIAVALVAHVALTIGASPPAAASDAPTYERCEWTYIPDQGAPEIPRDGRRRVEVNESWQRVASEGYHLVAVTRPPGTSPLFIFERCR